MYKLLWPVPGHSFVFSRWSDLSGYMLPDMYFQVGLMFICGRFSKLPAQREFRDFNARSEQ